MRLTDGGGNSDLHGHLWCWDDAVIDIGHESRVEAARKSFAGCGESRLCRSVVCFHEGENDHITNCRLNSIWTVHKTGRSTDHNLKDCQYYARLLIPTRLTLCVAWDPVAAPANVDCD